MVAPKSRLTDPRTRKQRAQLHVVDAAIVIPFRQFLALIIPRVSKRVQQLAQHTTAEGFHHHHKPHNNKNMAKHPQEFGAWCTPSD